MEAFTRRAISVISRIPQGKVTTYGIIAAAAGNHCGARQVARILHASSDKYHLPWHRVVNGAGRISPRPSMSHLEQRRLLEEEGIVFSEQDSIEFSEYLWLPDERIDQQRRKHE